MTDNEEGTEMRGQGKFDRAQRRMAGSSPRPDVVRSSVEAFEAALERRRAELETAPPRTVTVIVKFNQRTGEPRSLIYRTETEDELDERSEG